MGTSSAPSSALTLSLTVQPTPCTQPTLPTRTNAIRVEHFCQSSLKLQHSVHVNTVCNDRRPKRRLKFTVGSKFAVFMGAMYPNAHSVPTE